MSERDAELDADSDADSDADLGTVRPSRRGPSAEELRESMRLQMLASIGGWSGALIAAVPTVVFVAVNVVASLWPAIYAAVGAALLLTVYRLVRRQSVQQSLSGLFGVLVAALIAARTGQARGYFLFGIWTSFAYSVPFLVSVIVRRPLVGLLWEFLEPTPAAPGDRTPWWRRRPLLRAYTWATLAGFLLFALRGTVQGILYRHDSDSWLGIARIAMGYPLFILVVGFAFLLVRAARKVIAESLEPAASVAERQDGAA